MCASVSIGRGAGVNAIATIQANLPAGLAAIHEHFGELVELRILDKRNVSEPKELVGWENLNILRSEGTYEHIRERLLAKCERDYLPWACRLSRGKALGA
jgi:hypothetical protein